MKRYGEFYINGAWIKPQEEGEFLEVINPTSEDVFASVVMGRKADVDKAVAAAKKAFQTFSESSKQTRIDLINRVIKVYEKYINEFSELIALEVGIPTYAKAQVSGPLEHMKVARDLLVSYPFETHLGESVIRKEAVGVCALISPWNWPIQTNVIKIIYALAAGCTVVVKPSVDSPVSALLLAKVMHEAQIPAGVFNLINGSGEEVGSALANHPDVDMISFTGSTNAGYLVGEAAARSVKRTCLELGGKSANIILPDADLEKAVRWNIQRCFFNTGQSCHAPSRMLIHESQLELIEPIIIDEVSQYRIGNPSDPTTTMGPVVSQKQFSNIQGYIQSGIDEGARILVGGKGRPEGLHRGFFVQPTVFVDVKQEMKIAREEIFGPVLAVISYQTEEDALKIANNTPFGLGGYIFTSDADKGYKLAKHLKAGRVCFNGAGTNSVTPMGGFKQSGIGRSMGVLGLEEYLEVKSVYGFPAHAEKFPPF